MKLTPFEVLNRCDKMVDLTDERKPHSKHTITIYLSCALFFGDIDDDIFGSLLKYYGRKFEESP